MRNGEGSAYITEIFSGNSGGSCVWYHMDTATNDFRGSDFSIADEKHTRFHTLTHDFHVLLSVSKMDHVSGASTTMNDLNPEHVLTTLEAL